MTRGLEGRAIFFDDVDRLDLLDRLCEILPEAGMHCFGWALMTNHLHLVLQTGDEPLSRVMRRLDTGYAQAFNLRHDRRGYLFQDRFKSRLIEGDDDLVGVVRYVHLNALRAGLAGTLDELAGYRWCGHGALAGARSPLPFESVSATWALFAHDVEESKRRLRTWMEEGVNEGDSAESMFDEIGSDALTIVAESARPALASEGLDAVPAALHDLCRRLGVPWRALRGNRRERRLVEARAAVAYYAVMRLGIPGVRVAAMLGISRSNVSRALSRGRRVLAEACQSALS
jgi:REP element-mobilizing transposase RayT